VEERFHDTMVEDIISTTRRITSDVTKSPYGLLANIVGRGGQKLFEDRNGTSFNYNPGLFRRTRGNVGESPRSFELHKYEVKLTLDKPVTQDNRFF
jgi:hypothetical protein